MRLLHGISRIYFDPIRLIEIVIAFFTLVSGLYVISPIYEISLKQNGRSDFARALNNDSIILFMGAAMVVSALIVFVGLYNRLPQLKSIGWFAIGLIRLFQTSATLLSLGLLPLTWTLPLTISIISFILWANARVETLRRYA